MDELKRMIAARDQALASFARDLQAHLNGATVCWNIGTHGQCGTVTSVSWDGRALVKNARTGNAYWIDVHRIIAVDRGVVQSMSQGQRQPRVSPA